MKSDLFIFKIKIYELSIAVIIALTVYGRKIPMLNIPYYYIILPIVCHRILNSEKKLRNIYMSKIPKLTILVWMFLSIYGIIIIPFRASYGINFEYIYYNICFIFMTIILCHHSIISKNGYQRILKWFFIWSCAIALFGWYEALSGHIVNLTPGSYYYRKNFLGLTAPNTIFYNINDHAVFMSFSFFFGFIYSEISSYRKIIITLCFLLFASNILLVDSRGAELSILIFMLISMLISKKRIFDFWIFIITILLVPLMLNSALFLEGIINTGRREIWYNILYNIVDSYCIGVGPGNSKYVNMISNIYIASDAHNYFLEIFEDYGIFGFTFILFWYINILFISFRMRLLNPQMKYLFSAILCFIPLSIISSSLIGRSWFLLFFILIVSTINYWTFKEAVSVKEGI